MPALPLKVLNPHQPLGLAERFLPLLRQKVAPKAEQSEINRILILLLVGWADLVALPLPRGDDRDLGLLPREATLGPGHLSGVDHGLHRDGGDLEVPRDVAALGHLSGQSGPGAEITREEADLDQ